MSLKLANIFLLLAIPMAYAPPPPEVPNANITSANVEELLVKVFNLERVRPVICGVGRECVPRYLCQDDAVNKHGIDIISFRIDDEIEKCPDLQTCCALDKQIPEKTKNSGTVLADQRGQCWRNYILFIGLAVFSKYVWPLRSC